MTCLREHLAQREPERTIWINGGVRLDKAAVEDLLSGHWPTVQQVAGQRVALQFSGSGSYVLAYVLLDGFAAAMMPLPNELGDDALEDFLRRAHIDLFITDRRRDALEVEQMQVDWRLERRPPAGRMTTLALSPGRMTEWLIVTSGTTGTPKIVSHTLSSLTRTTQFKRTEQPVIWGMPYDPTRFAGLQVFFQAFMGHGTLAFPKRSGDVESLVEVLRSEGCNALSATPTLWRKLLMTEGFADLPLHQITLGGEIADRQILGSLRRMFPDARIVHIYASTEAGVGFVVKDGREGFPVAWAEQPPSGVEIKVGAQGQLLLRTSEAASRGEEWMDTGDLVQREGDRYLFLGRSNGSINVGGNKVMPEEVERRIREVEGVADVQVRGRASSIMGSLVEALVVPDSAVIDPNDLIKRVRAHCDRQLDSFKVPAVITLRPALETSPAGKASRKQ